MSKAARPAAGIDPSWLLDVVDATQLLCAALTRSSAAEIAASLRRFSDRVYSPAMSVAERLAVDALLLRVFARKLLEATNSEPVSDQDDRLPILSLISAYVVHRDSWRDDLHDSLAHCLDIFEQTRHQPLSSKVATWVGAHLGERLSRFSIARQFGVSANQLDLVFRETFGLTVTRYIKCARLKAGVALLQSSDLKIEAVSLLVGFRSKKNFYSAVHKTTGKTPGAIRDKARQRPTCNGPIGLTTIEVTPCALSTERR